MLHTTSFALVWITVHLVGVATTLLVRMHLGGRYEGLVQRCFLLSLTGVALSTAIGYHTCQQIWSLSAATLASMIIMAVVDFGPERSVATNLEG